MTKYRTTDMFFWGRTVFLTKHIWGKIPWTNSNCNFHLKKAFWLRPSLSQKNSYRVDQTRQRETTIFFVSPSWTINHISFNVFSSINKSKPTTENGRGKILTSKWKKNISNLSFKVSNIWFQIFENDVPGIRVNKYNDQFVWFNFHQVTKALNHCLLKCKCSSHIKFAYQIVWIWLKFISCMYIRSYIHLKNIKNF